MKTKFAGMFVAVLSLELVAGCGSSTSSGGSCGKVQPCGGSVIGNWNITNSCLTNSTVALNSSTCATATASIVDLQITGTSSYNANMTFTSAIIVSSTVTLHLPPACVTFGGIALTCAQFNSAVQASSMINPDPNVKSFSCVAAGANCDCTVVANPVAQDGSGTYTTVGNVITNTSTTGTVNSNNYCVQGNELHLIPNGIAMSMGMAGQVTLKGDVVLTKQ